MYRISIFTGSPAALIVIIMSGCSFMLRLASLEERYYETIVQDTFAVSIVPVSKISGTVPAVGDSISLPASNISMVRISEKELLIKTPIRKETLTEYRNKVIPVRTKQVDRSRHYQDSYNRTDAINRVSTKDKSRTDSNNKQKEKTDNSTKSVKRTSSFPWWWWLIIVCSLGVFWLIRKNLWLR